MDPKYHMSDAVKALCLQDGQKIPAIKLFRDENAVKTDAGEMVYPGLRESKEAVEEYMANPDDKTPLVQISLLKETVKRLKSDLQEQTAKHWANIDKIDRLEDELKGANSRLREAEGVSASVDRIIELRDFEIQRLGHTVEILKGIIVDGLKK